MDIFLLFVLICCIPFSGITAKRVYGLYINYHKALDFGVPIKIVPWNRQDDIWLIVWRHFYPCVKALPFNLGSWIDYSFHGWNVHSRFRPWARELGDVFVIVTPKQNEIVFLDPVAGMELEAKYKTWYKPRHHYGIFNLFGRNLLTVNGEEWQRHRKITGPAFRELTYRLVWNEALRQADQMVTTARGRPGGANLLDNVKKDSIVFAMHTLSAAVFGHKQEFAGGVRQVKAGHDLSFSDTLWFIFSHFLTIVMFRDLNPPAWLTPKWLADMKVHVREFRQYLEEAIDEQRRVGPSPAGSGADVVSALVQANELAKDEDLKTRTPSSRRSYLNDDELYGNMFILNLVGMEPPAAALMHVIPFLAAHRDVQDWVGEEIDAVLGDLEDLVYEDIYPRLVRCNAVIHETLRFWGPLGDTTRICLNEAEHLHVQGHDLLVPPKTYVNWDFAGAQTNTRFWGADALTWRPQRWIHPNLDATAPSDPTVKEILAPPSPAAEAAFNAWSDGPRVCPGKKFSQVEIVALLAVLLRRCRLEPLLIAEQGMNNEKDARVALLDVVNDGMMPRRAKGERGRDAGVVFLGR